MCAFEPPEMTAADKAWHATWRPVSGHPGGWRVCRQFFAPLAPEPGAPTFQTATGPGGKIRLFKTHSSALRAAAKLNAA